MRATVAMALGIVEQEIAEIWKDQREVSARDVAILANSGGDSGRDRRARRHLDARAEGGMPLRH